MSPIVRQLPDGFHLARGSHKEFLAGACAMEAAAYIAGEPHSDRPECVCPVIAAFMRSWNDGLNDEDRDRLLLPLLPVVIGTRSTSPVRFARSMLCVDWLVREFTPAWCDLVPAFAENAKALRRLAPIRDEAALVAAQQVIFSARAAFDVARVAAWAVARVAAWVAAWDVARDAAYAAAYAAAWVASREALKPTVEKLQVSAVELVRAMAEVKEGA